MGKKTKVRDDYPEQLEASSCHLFRWCYGLNVKYPTKIDMLKFSSQGFIGS